MDSLHLDSSNLVSIASDSVHLGIQIKKKITIEGSG